MGLLVATTAFTDLPKGIAAWVTQGALSAKIWFQPIYLRCKAFFGAFNECDLFLPLATAKESTQRLTGVKTQNSDV